MNAPTESRVPTNMRTLLILEAIGQSEIPMTPTEVGETLGLPKQTVHRVCNTLVEEAFLVRSATDRKLRPARRMRDLAASILQASRYHIARRQILMDFASQVGETVNFVMPEDDGMSYIDRVETDWAFRVQLPIGSSVPFHCTASGKCFLAQQPKRTRDALVSTLQLSSLTRNTIKSPELLLAELKQIARQGYAIDREEFMDGMVAMAVPVFDTKRNFVAALAFHGPTLRLNVDEMPARLELMETAADKISAIMFTESD